MSPELRLFRPFAIADHTGLLAAPAAALVELRQGTFPTLLAVGTQDAVSAHPAATHARTTDLPDSLILPSLVNAHTHLDLTHIGPRPFDPDKGFAAWARMIIAERFVDSDPLARSVLEGICLSLAGGVAAVGDIAGVMQSTPIHTIANSPLLGVSFIEYFGLGPRQTQSIDRITSFLRTLGMSESSSRRSDRAGESRGTVRLGLQPHAPYTAGPRLMQWTAEHKHAHNTPICTHLAETAAEHEFIAHATGPFRALLEHLNLWDDSILNDCAKGEHPIAHLAHALRITPWLLAHVNDCDDEGLRTLAETRAAVAYCPRSSHYFRNHESFGPHRYRDMLHVGINVCLGTDSIVNLPADESDRLSTLDEMRFLHRRDHTDPFTLLQMATVNGARALDLDPSLFTLRSRLPRPIAGLIAVNLDPSISAPSPLHRALLSPTPPRITPLCT
jgi:cytosine/adenosine deaminase-related metal-dependent hydrolase